MAHLLSARVLRILPTLVLVAVLASSVVGCATRNVRHPISNDYLMKVDLVREVKGFTTVEREFDHPAVIAPVRLSNILRALEVEMNAEDGTIRQPAIHPAIVNRVAEELSEALEKASPSEEVAVKAVRKQRRLGVLDTKYLTTFLAYVKNDQLYLSLRRVDWPLPTGAETTKTKNVFPDPIRERKSMDFRVVTGEPIYFAGQQDLEIDWRNDAFENTFHLPGTSKGRKRRRQVLETSRIPQEERPREESGGMGIDQLTPEQLRALADLEEDRREGRITETAYQRQRRQLLRQR
ncbi:MAG: hypothetical protein CL931_14490 [Deltaproteobacteria bacterium]|nr:hypothetical protein [Deltaproteobacteria bacterium]